MKNTFLKYILAVRAAVNRTLFPAQFYWLPVKSTEPLSVKFGLDRGTAIDRYWVESFLRKNRHHIHGRVLEVGDRRYTKMFGTQIILSDVLDRNRENKEATVHADIRNLRGTLGPDFYDCIILTHVIGMVDDIPTALAEVRRVLRPGGVLLVTSACFTPNFEGNKGYWRFTDLGARYLFSKIFHKVEVNSFGNVLSGAAFWAGLSQEDLSESELAFNDPNYPCMIGIKAIK